MEIFYQNSSGEKIYFDRFPYKMLAVTSLFDYKWEYSTQGSYAPKIVKFSKNMVSKDIDVVVFGSTCAEYKNNVNKLLEVIDKDIINISKGKLYVGGSYLECYFIANSKPAKYVNVKKSRISLTILAENGNWLEDEKIAFGKITNQIYNEDGFDYPFDYLYDYTNTLVNQVINNTSYAPSDFELIVYGSCSNPKVSIGFHTYEVTADLSTGEYLVINSRTHKIYKVKNNGEIVNLFDDRGRDFYIFEKIPSGISNVSWEGGFGFDITLLMERSEPKWT